MIDKEKPAVATATAPAPSVGSTAPAPVPPKRSPGHRGADVKDTVAEMAAKAHEISLEAGSKMAAAMKDVIGVAAGRAGQARCGEARRSGEKARREKADDEARRQKAPGQSRVEIQAESLGQDREEKVGRGNSARRCSFACPRPHKNRFQKSDPRPGLTRRG